MYDAFTEKTSELMSGVVSRIDDRSGALYVKLMANGETTEAMLSAGEQVKGEVYHHEATASRSMWWRCAAPPGVLRWSFPAPITVWCAVCLRWKYPRSSMAWWEIRSIAREVKQPHQDGGLVQRFRRGSHRRLRGHPRPACVNTIVEELGGEKVDIIKYSDDPGEYVAAALAPADVVSVEVLDSDAKSCRVVVPDDQLSLAIGKEGPERPSGRQADQLQDRHQVRHRRRAGGRARARTICWSRRMTTR